MAYYPRLIALEGKHPGDVVDYRLRYTNWLADEETLTSQVVTAEAGITLGTGGNAAAISGDDVVFWLSGGTTGAAYAVQITVTTSDGRTLVADCSVTVTDPTP
jgi:hypothetical protein